MKLLKRVKSSKYHLIVSVLPVILLTGSFKVLAHFLGWEVFPKELTIFFPSILTGIIFLLGFLLAGVVSDYKESEKIPNEIGVSIHSLWVEAEFLYEVSGYETSKSILKDH